MRWPVPAVRAIGITLMVVAVALSVALTDPWLRVVLVSLAIAAGWMTHSAAERRTSVEPAAGWVRPHQRVDPELRRLTNLLLLYVREIFTIRERIRERAQDAAQGRARLDEIRREMGELVERIVRAGAAE